MCIALYLFTNNQVDEIAFDESTPAFYIERITGGSSESDRMTNEWGFSESNIYYLGSSQGCGCGWAALDEKHDAEIEIAKMINDREKLRQLLSSKDFNGSRLIACWEGDQGKPLKRREPIRLSDIVNLHFDFEECVNYVLCK